MFKKLQNGKGFTLIELLVVIAIIGILAVLIILNLSTARKKARDAQRKSDLSQVQVALESYADDNNSYPSASYTSPQGVFSSTGVLSAYLNKNVDDPQKATKHYTYTSISGGYELCAIPEIDSNRNNGTKYCISQK